jgi:hypothetical protein
MDFDYRGLSILRCEPDEALRLKGQDPAVQAGVRTRRDAVDAAGRCDPFHADDIPAVDPRRVRGTAYCRRSALPRTRPQEARLCNGL